jgi:hypothetical protein
LKFTARGPFGEEKLTPADTCPTQKFIAELKTFDIQLRSIISASLMITAGGGKIANLALEVKNPSRGMCKEVIIAA